MTPPLPLPVRIAAGLVVTAVEQARDLPRLALELPVTAVSQALQASMRVQQKVTELALKGDRVLGTGTPVEDEPAWATFDDDLPPRRRGAETADTATVTPLRTAPDPFVSPGPVDPGSVDPGPTADATTADTTTADDQPAVVPGYADLTIPQLRGKLRHLGVDDLRGLLAWEQAHGDRPPYVTMLTNRIATVTEGVSGEQPTSAEAPWPVRTVARKIAAWVDRLGAVWVEGQLAQVTARPGTGTAFLVLRDPAADVSLQLTAPIGLVRDGGAAVAEGNRVVVHGKPSFFLGRGTLSLRVDTIRAVGIGELLARIERLRALLAAEGLFDAARKRRVPFLPGCIGLVTGRASAAEHDVVSNATARWPAVRFRLEHTAVQGALAVPQIVDALGVLDRDPQVDVIVLARGGGSVEDLLAFSDETLCRAVAACRTPVVSAIGHEPDTPLVDHVADLRCSTPTEAGRRLVPDVAEETARIAGLRDRARRALAGWVDREERLLASLRHRPALADPLRGLQARHADVERLRDAARACVTRGLDRRGTDIGHLAARLTALGPAATLARGYAVVQRVPDGHAPGAALPVLRSATEAGPGTRLRVRVADGALGAVVEGPLGDATRAVETGAMEAGAP